MLPTIIMVNTDFHKYYNIFVILSTEVVLARCTSFMGKFSVISKVYCFGVLFCFYEQSTVWCIFMLILLPCGEKTTYKCQEQYPFNRCRCIVTLAMLRRLIKYYYYYYYYYYILLSDVQLDLYFLLFNKQRQMFLY